MQRIISKQAQFGPTFDRAQQSYEQEEPLWKEDLEKFYLWGTTTDNKTQLVVDDPFESERGIRAYIQKFAGEIREEGYIEVEIRDQFGETISVVNLL